MAQHCVYTDRTITEIWCVEFELSGIISPLIILSVVEYHLLNLCHSYSEQIVQSNFVAENLSYKSLFKILNLLKISMEKILSTTKSG